MRISSLVIGVAALSHPALTLDADTHECMISPRSIVNDACASYATLEQLNDKVKPVLDDLVATTDFFSHYRLNLFNKRCPFWNDESGTCGNKACAVETLDDEKDIPEIWRAKELGKLEGPVAKHPGKKLQKERPAQKPLQGGLGENIGESCVVEYDDECDERDYCVPEDESATSKGDYVSLLKNPERFTGYAGAGARQVWDTIYGENCFQKSSFPHSANLGQSSFPQGPAVHDFKQVLQAVSRQQVFDQGLGEKPNNDAAAGAFGDEECLEKRVFYRVVSGMHASINTHLCWDYFNQTTGEWTRNLNCYKFRLHKFPDRISNLYFNYALVSRAIAKLGPYLQGPEYTYCMGDPSEDGATRAKVLAVTEGAASVPHLFDESLMFKNGEGPSLKEDFRNRFRNVSRVMDCVGCDKCRLWGKLQTAGYGTALKVLFEFDNDSGEIPVLSRTEIVALFNTYARVSNSMKAIHEFRLMIEAEEQMTEGAEQTIKDVPSVTDKVPVVEAVAATAPEEESQSSALTAEQQVSTAVAAVTDASDIPTTTEAATYTQAMEEYTYWEPYTDEEIAERKAAAEEAAEAAQTRQETAAKARLPKKKNHGGSSAMDELWLVWDIIKFILSSWIELPRQIVLIAASEVIRGVQFFLGLPVHPRIWTAEFQDHMEL